MTQSIKTYVPAAPPSPGKEEPAAPPQPEKALSAPVAETVPPPARHVAEPADAVKEYREITEGAQYVPAPKPPTLLEILPAEYQTTNPPLIYRLSTVDDPSRPDGRIATSRTYRAKAFSCGFFYKPISRFLVEWDDK